MPVIVPSGLSVRVFNESETEQGDLYVRALMLDVNHEVTIRAGPAGVRFVLVAGRPLHEPIAWGGPIVMNT